mgnify:CR=1 FL=1
MKKIIIDDDFKKRRSYDDHYEYYSNRDSEDELVWLYEEPPVNILRDTP